MNKQSLSVVISAYNESKKIERCLTSVYFADEIIVVDNTSQDNTKQIAKKFTKHVYSRPNKLMLNENKNFGFAKANSEWILNLDADEEIPENLKNEIETVINSPTASDGYWIKRKNYSFGKWIQHGLWWPDKQLRLFRRTKGIFPCVHIHEYISVNGTVSELTEPYIHYNYESIEQYLIKINRASTSEALSLSDAQYVLRWYDAIRFPISDFLKIYFAQKGYKDGLHGLTLALLQSFYSFCVFAKYWEMKHFIQKDLSQMEIVAELAQRGKEIKFWMIQSHVDQAPGLLKTYLLKLEQYRVKKSL